MLINVTFCVFITKYWNIITYTRYSFRYLNESEIFVNLGLWRNYKIWNFGILTNLNHEDHSDNEILYYIPGYYVKHYLSFSFFFRYSCNNHFHETWTYTTYLSLCLLLHQSSYASNRAPLVFFVVFMFTSTEFTPLA